MAAGTSGRRGGTIVWEVPEAGGGQPGGTGLSGWAESQAGTVPGLWKHGARRGCRHAPAATLPYQRGPGWHRPPCRGTQLLGGASSGCGNVC